MNYNTQSSKQIDFSENLKLAYAKRRINDFSLGSLNSQNDSQNYDSLKEYNGHVFEMIQSF